MINYDCPCGGVAVYRGALMPGGRVVCNMCQYAGPDRVDPDEARAAWNQQVADWIQRNKSTEEAYTVVSQLRPEIERAARKGLGILDAAGDLKQAFSAVQLHMEMVVQELDRWTLLDELVAQAQNRIKAEVDMRRVARASGVWDQSPWRDAAFGLYDDRDYVADTARVTLPPQEVQKKPNAKTADSPAPSSRTAGILTRPVSNGVSVVVPRLRAVVPIEKY